FRKGWMQNSTAKTRRNARTGDSFLALEIQDQQIEPQRTQSSQRKNREKIENIEEPSSPHSPYLFSAVPPCPLRPLWFNLLLERLPFDFETDVVDVKIVALRVVAPERDAADQIDIESGFLQEARDRDSHLLVLGGEPLDEAVFDQPHFA